MSLYRLLHRTSREHFVTFKNVVVKINCKIYNVENVFFVLNNVIDDLCLS